MIIYLIVNTKKNIPMASSDKKKTAKINAINNSKIQFMHVFLFIWETGKILCLEGGIKVRHHTEMT